MKRPDKASETSNDTHAPHLDTQPELTPAQLEQSVGGAPAQLQPTDDWEAPVI